MSSTMSKSARAQALTTSKNFAAASTKHDGFGTFASTASTWLGSKWAFLAAILIIVLWGSSGPLFH